MTLEVVVADLRFTDAVAAGFQLVGVDGESHLIAVGNGGNDLQVQVVVVVELPAGVTGIENTVEDEVLRPVGHDGFNRAVNIVVVEGNVVQQDRTRPVDDIPATGIHAVILPVLDVAGVVSVADVRLIATVDTGYIREACNFELQDVVGQIPAGDDEAQGIGIEIPVGRAVREVHQVLGELDMDEVDRTVFVRILVPDVVLKGAGNGGGAVRQTGGDLYQHITLTVAQVVDRIQVENTGLVTERIVGTGFTGITEGKTLQRTAGYFDIGDVSEIEVAGGDHIPVIFIEDVVDILGEIHHEVVNLTIRRRDVVVVVSGQLVRRSLVDQNHGLIDGRVRYMIPDVTGTIVVKR